MSTIPANYFRDKSLAAGEGHAWKAHRCAVLTLVVRGELREGFAEGEQICRAFEVHYKPPGAPHATRTGAHGVRMLMVGICAESLLLSPLVRHREPVVLMQGARSARALANFLEVANGEEFRPLSAESVLPFVKGLGLELPVPVEAHQRAAWVSEAHELLTEDAGRPRSLADLAARFRVHPVHAARSFRLAYGLTIGAYQRKLRVDRAIDLLTQPSELTDSGRSDLSTVSLSSVALEVGYSDQSHFCREFKRHTGWSPGRFRSAARRLVANG